MVGANDSNSSLRETHTQTHRQRDREAETHTQTHRQRDRETETHTHRHTTNLNLLGLGKVVAQKRARAVDLVGVGEGHVDLKAVAKLGLEVLRRTCARDEEEGRARGSTHHTRQIGRLSDSLKKREIFFGKFQYEKHKLENCSDSGYDE